MVQDGGFVGDLQVRPGFRVVGLRGSVRAMFGSGRSMQGARVVNGLL
jgi:hypothetical protein